MTRSRTLLALALASTALGGCTFTFGQPRPLTETADTRLVQATPAPPPVIEAMEPPAIHMPPDQVRAMPARTSAPRTAPDPVDAVRTANRKATQRPSSQGFLEAVQVYDYVPGAIYQVYTTPLHVTTIALRPGESMTKLPAAGDTVRWAIGQATAGAPPLEQQIIYVKPFKEGLSTNMIITTNERLYMIELTSLESPPNQKPIYNAAIAWNYPLLEMEQMRAETKAAVRKEENTIAAAIDPTKLNNDYSITTVQGRDPAWKPVRAFDDGKKTWIEFPPNLGSVEAPPLFVLTAQSDLALVNVRIKGRYYIVDQLFNEAELRIGQEPQTIVRISNNRPVGGA